MQRSPRYRPYVARAYARLFRPVVAAGGCRSRLDRLSARWWTRLDVAVYRHLGLSLGVKALGVHDVLVLRTRGRRSGQVREVLVAYVELGGAKVICGANGGFDRQPAWFENLRDDGPVEIERRGHRQAVQPVQLEGGERRAALAAMCDAFPYLRLYLERTTRRFPLLRLESLEAPASVTTCRPTIEEARAARAPARDGMR